MLLGLTGSAGSGKSMALGVFAENGWLPLDADVLCHRLYDEAGGSLPVAFASRWGSSVLRPDGKVDRRAVARIVFADASEREWLDAAARPKILDLAFSLLKSSGAANAVLEAAVLFEASWQGLCDFTVCVWAAPEIVRARLAGRGWSDSEIDARLAAQIAPDRKLELADFGVVNNASPELLRAQCAALSTLILNNSKI